MCKNSEIILSEKKEEIKKWCGGDCKKCPFGEVFSVPETDTHSWLVNTTEDIKDIIENNEK
jgi:hypothetical protein